MEKLLLQPVKPVTPNTPRWRTKVGDRLCGHKDGSMGQVELVATLAGFAGKHRLKLKRDECGEVIIPGRHGQIYEYGSGRFGCMVLAKSSRIWNASRRKLIAAGSHLIQNGDLEGTALFDPADTGQARLAIQAIRARRKRILSEAQKAVLVDRLRTSPQDQVTADVCFISSEAA